MSYVIFLFILCVGEAWGAQTHFSHSGPLFNLCTWNIREATGSRKSFRISNYNGGVKVPLSVAEPTSLIKSFMNYDDRLRYLDEVWNASDNKSTYPNVQVTGHWNLKNNLNFGRPLSHRKSHAKASGVQILYLGPFESYGRFPESLSNTGDYTSVGIDGNQQVIIAPPKIYISANHVNIENVSFVHVRNFIIYNVPGEKIFRNVIFSSSTPSEFIFNVSSFEGTNSRLSLSGVNFYSSLRGQFVVIFNVFGDRPNVIKGDALVFNIYEMPTKNQKKYCHKVKLLGYGTAQPFLKMPGFIFNARALLDLQHLNLEIQDTVKFNFAGSSLKLKDTTFKGWVDFEAGENSIVLDGSKLLGNSTFKVNSAENILEINNFSTEEGSNFLVDGASNNVLVKSSHILGSLEVTGRGSRVRLEGNNVVANLKIGAGCALSVENGIFEGSVKVNTFKRDLVAPAVAPRMEINLSKVSLRKFALEALAANSIYLEDSTLEQGSKIIFQPDLANQLSQPQVDLVNSYFKGDLVNYASTKAVVFNVKGHSELSGRISSEAGIEITQAEGSQLDYGSLNHRPIKSLHMARGAIFNGLGAVVINHLDVDGSVKFILNLNTSHLGAHQFLYDIQQVEAATKSIKLDFHGWSAVLGQLNLTYTINAIQMKGVGKYVNFPKGYRSELFKMDFECEDDAKLVIKVTNFEALDTFVEHLTQQEHLPSSLSVTLLNLSTYLESLMKIKDSSRVSEEVVDYIVNHSGGDKGNLGTYLQNLLPVSVNAFHTLVEGPALAMTQPQFDGSDFELNSPNTVAKSITLSGVNPRKVDLSLGVVNLNTTRRVGRAQGNYTNQLMVAAVNYRVRTYMGVGLKLGAALGNASGPHQFEINAPMVLGSVFSALRPLPKTSVIGTLMVGTGHMYTRRESVALRGKDLISNQGADIMGTTLKARYDLVSTADPKASYNLDIGGGLTFLRSRISAYHEEGDKGLNVASSSVTSKDITINLQGCVKTKVAAKYTLKLSGQADFTASVGDSYARTTYQFADSRLNSTTWANTQEEPWHGPWRAGANLSFELDLPKGDITVYTTLKEELSRIATTTMVGVGLKWALT